MELVESVESNGPNLKYLTLLLPLRLRSNLPKSFPCSVLTPDLCHSIDFLFFPASLFHGFVISIAELERLSTYDLKSIFDVRSLYSAHLTRDLV